MELLERRALFSALLPGDANYDGRVDGDDYFAIDAGFAVSARGYDRGDFNRDGRIDGDDYVIIDSRHGLSNADVTGLLDAKLLRPTGPIDTTAHGQVIENLDFDGIGITFRHNNVIVRNCRFRNAPTPFWKPPGTAALSGIRIEDCYIEWTGGDAGIHTGISLYRNHIKNASSGDFWQNPGNCVWEGNFFEDDGPVVPGAHKDIIQWFQPTFTRGDMIIRGNFFRGSGRSGDGHNAIIYNNYGVTHISIADNVFEGGAYTISTSGGPGMSISGNVFSAWSFAPIQFYGTPADAKANLAFANNTAKLWDRTFAAIDLSSTWVSYWQ